MPFFNDLLAKRQLDACPTPLWKLKIKDNEYQELKTLLAQESVSRSSNTPYKELCRECALFYAEYWRREYKGGYPSRRMVFDALDVKSLQQSDNWSELFYNSAVKGAKLLNIEIYDGGRAMPFYSMLYQGGVPMNLVIQTNYNGNWDRFVRGLVFRNINFEDLDLGRVASQSQSMRLYCSQLSDAVNMKQYKRLPFYCDNEYNVWFQFLLNKFSSVRESHRLSNPFLLDYECTIDDRGKKITINYNLKGMQRLPLQFIKKQELINVPFFTINVNKNGRTENSFDYINGFCRYEVQCILKYSDGDVISLNINDREDPFISETLDMNTPHLLYQTINRTFKFGNKIGKERSLLIIPKEWSIESCDKLQEPKDYTWEERKFKVVLIPSEFNLDLIVYGPDGKMTFSSKSFLYWTKLSGNMLNSSLFIEPVYNANKTSFFLCSDGDENVVRNIGRPVEFRDKWGNSWKKVPSYGEILARTIEQNGSFVTPVRFINVGEDSVVSVASADGDTCKIKVNWKYGSAIPTFGRELTNGYWLIKKDECKDPRKIPILFTPDDNIRNAFVLNLKAPFIDFSICDDNDVPLENNQYIPFSDLDRFQYHIHGIEVRPFRFGNQERTICLNGNTLNILGNNLLRNIPFDGALIRLFDSREQIRQMLDLTSKNMLEATVPVEFVLNNGERLTFEIKEFPYRLDQIDNKLKIYGKNGQKINYNYSLKALSISTPEEDPVIIDPDNDFEYQLPDDINKWGKTLVIGCTPGRICPLMVDLTQTLSPEERVKIRNETLASIISELKDAKLGSSVWKRVSVWFNLSQKDDIPASSLLDLYCVALNPDTLLKFIFVIYLETLDNDKENLLQKLIYFSNDLSFQWFWLLPSITGIADKLLSFIDDIQTPSLKEYYIQWALNQNDKAFSYINDINDEEQYSKNCVDFVLMPAIDGFYNWIKKLCELSLQESYFKTSTNIEESLISELVNNFDVLKTINYENIELVDNNQENLDQETNEFFFRYSENGHTQNEQWLCQRVNVLASHMKGEIQIFSQPDTIRRSLIFCFKSTRELFLLILNNKLAQI